MRKNGVCSTNRWLEKRRSKFRWFNYPHPFFGRNTQTMDSNGITTYIHKTRYKRYWGFSGRWYSGICFNYISGNLTIFTGITVATKTRSLHPKSDPGSAVFILSQFLSSVSQDTYCRCSQGLPNHSLKNKLFSYKLPFWKHSQFFFVFFVFC